MMNLDHGWTQRSNESRDYILYCTNPDCGHYLREQVVPGFYETDTGWGEPDWIECRECDEPMQSWLPSEEAAWDAKTREALRRNGRGDT